MAASAEHGGGERPILTLDFDGVICMPPFGTNLGIRRRLIDPHAEPERAFVPPRWFGGPADHLRFAFRRPAEEARSALERLAETRRLVILTGRRSSPDRWLRRHGLDQLIERVMINDGPHGSAHYKLRCVNELGAAEHIDDDGPTAQLLADRSAARVYLRDWPRNRGLAYSDGVTRVHDLASLASRLASGERAQGRGSSD
ncbi:MAG: hypothetical protein V3S31_06745 [Dehalococcoidia bacterium]